jgi:hypothetical protein
MPELLLGCGHHRAKLLGPPGKPLKFTDLVTLDINERCKPDLICDLDAFGWVAQSTTERGEQALQPKPGYAKYQARYLASNHFDEIHAYEVLEHLGTQGDAASFFAHFSNLWRILRPNGILYATCPSRHSAWLWGDPSHRRAITQESLVFLSKERVTQFRAQAGNPISDFDHLWDKDFKILASEDNHNRHMFCLQAIKVDG